jgi:hypothetical protein
MDEPHADQQGHEHNSRPRRGRRVVTALLAAGALAAIPAGVALAGGSDGTAGADGGSSGTGALPAQSTTPEEGQQDRGGDRGDCPEKGEQQSGQESVQL